jgi:adenylate cyclase
MFKSKKRLAAQIGILVVTVLFALGAHRFFAPMAVAENWSSDLRITWVGTTKDQNPDIVLVTITEDTLSSLPYRSPVDRAFLATILKSMQKAGPRVVGFDFLFDQPTEEEKDSLFRQIALDMPFPVIVGWADPVNGLTNRQYSFQKEYLDGISAGYSILPKNKSDGTVRFTYPGKMEEGQFRRGFAPLMAEHLGLDTPREFLRLVYQKSPEDQTIKTFRSFPAHSMLIPQIAKWVKDKIVLVGADLPHKDRHRTPFVAGRGAIEGSIPGVMIHAHILAQLMAGQLDKGTYPAVELAIALTLGVIALLLVFSEKPLIAKLSGGVATLLLLLTGNIVAFASAGILLPIVAPSTAFAVAIGLSSAFGAAQSRHIRTAFGHYLAPAMVKQMADEGSLPEQGGELRDISVWISDLENYTTLSEIYAPTELVKVLNSVYTVMGDKVEEHGGFVAQFVGDAMVAAFGAPMDDPNHADNAVRSALACQEVVAELQKEMTLPEGLRLHNRIGISTGKLLAGNIGSKSRLSYTILGDDINLASRLEGVNKVYGSSVLVNEVTKQGCGDDLRFREVDIVRVKGRNAPVRIFEPLPMNVRLSAEDEEDLERYAEALAVFREGHFADSAAMFGALSNRDPVAAAMAGRSQELEADPPADWNGINTLLSK